MPFKLPRTYYIALKIMFKKCCKFSINYFRLAKLSM